MQTVLSILKDIHLGESQSYDNLTIYPLLKIFVSITPQIMGKSADFFLAL